MTQNWRPRTPRSKGPRPISFPRPDSSLPDLLQWLAIWDPAFVIELHDMAHARVQRIRKNQRRNDAE